MSQETKREKECTRCHIVAAPTAVVAELPQPGDQLGRPYAKFYICKSCWDGFDTWKKPPGA